MENKIDQFFKDKLEGHSLPPSEEAWAKVEANLSKKNNVVVWRIAAAILIAGALVSVIFWTQGDREKDQHSIASGKSPKEKTIKEKPTPRISSVEKKEEAKSFQKKSSIALPRSVSSQTENNSDQKKEEENKTESAKTPTTTVENIVAEKSERPTIVSENRQEEKLNTKATPPTAIASTRQKPIKLEFTLTDYSSEQPVATVNEEKSSGLKKVWNLAREVKNGDGPVRELKNEIFAHNFKKSKNQ